MTTFKLDHVAVAVRDIDDAVDNFEQKLGLACERVEVVPTEKAKVAFFDVGGAHLELVASTEASSSIARSIDKRGEGLHHVAFAVDDIRAEMKRLQEEGFRLLNPEPLPGADGKIICFLHPKDTAGVLVELCQDQAVQTDGPSSEENPL